MTTERRLRDAVKRLEQNPESNQALADVFVAMAEDDPAKERARRVKEVFEVRKLNAWRAKAKKV